MDSRRRPRISVFRDAGRKYLQLKIRWPDGRMQRKSAKTTRMREAERLAARLEDELEEPGKPDDQRLLWREFAQRYRDEYLQFRSKSALESFGTASWQLREMCGVHHLEEVTPSLLSQFAAKILAGGRSQQTAKSRVAQIQAAVNWGANVGLVEHTINMRLNLVDRSQMPRPLTTEEFERMLAATPKVVGEGVAGSWQYLLRGYWLSGMRLSEALSLHWTDPRQITVERLDFAEPRLAIPADRQKGRRAELYPITPDFAQLLQETPREDREGYVFRPRLTSRKGRVTRARETVGRVISEIGQRARVVVRKDSSGTHYATAKNLRHSFGARWAPHVPELVLLTLMRHRSVETTRKYYLGIAAEETSRRVQSAWRQLGDGSGTTFGTTPPESDVLAEEGDCHN